MRAIPLMKEFGYPVIFDATHGGIVGIIMGISAGNLVSFIFNMGIKKMVKSGKIKMRGKAIQILKKVWMLFLF